jgi:hypothetical protein
MKTAVGSLALYFAMNRPKSRRSDASLAAQTSRGELS